MAVRPGIRAVFGHFQNLNLLALVQDLRDGRAARHGWLVGERLCPIAHGLPAGRQIRDLKVLGQAADLKDGCRYAAEHLGADADAVLRFVRLWDDEELTAAGLLRQLEQLWHERLEDAIAVQEVLQGPSTLVEPGRMV